MQEREVTKTVAERLQNEGLTNMKVRYRNERGPDIEGILPRSRRRLYVEAKGERKLAATGTPKGNARMAMGEALLQVLSAYDSDVVCAIALPYTEAFESVVRNILKGLRSLGLHILLAREDELWYLGPRASGFFPEKPDSIIEALEQ